MKKFDEYEEERKKEEQIKCLEERLSFLGNKNGEIEQQIDTQTVLQKELPPDTWHQRKNA